MDAVSAVGRCNTNFAAPDRDSISGRGPNTKLGAVLSLGVVQHTMRVRIDSEHLPSIDPTNPILDISNWIKSGQTHTIDVEVRTPLFNYGASRGGIAGCKWSFTGSYREAWLHSPGNLGTVVFQPGNNA